MSDKTPPNKWLLVQIGKDGYYHVFAYSSRATAEREAKHGERYGVLAVVANLDDLVREATGDG